MSSKKWYGTSLGGAIKVAYAQNIPPEDLVIITNTRFDSIDHMIENYGPREDGRGRWTAEEAAYAARVWEKGEIIQPRLHAHAVYEREDSSRNFVGYEPGAAELGSDSDTSVYISGSSLYLYSDITQVLSRDADYQLIEILQQAHEFPEFKDVNGETIDIRTYMEQNADALKYVYTMSEKDSTLTYEADENAPVDEIRIPEGITRVDIENVRVVYLSETVNRVDNWGDNTIIVCADEVQRDLLDRKSYGEGVYMSQDEYTKFSESGYSNPTDFLKANSDVFLHNEQGEIIGIRDIFKRDITTVEIPEGAKIDVESFAESLRECKKVSSVVENGSELDKQAWLREHDPEPLRLSEDGTSFYGVKWYHSNIDTITLPDTVRSLDMEVFMENAQNGIKTVISDNPDLKLSLPAGYLVEDEEIPQIELIVAGKEPQNFVTAMKEQNNGVYMDSYGHIEGIHPLYKDDKVLVIPEGAVAYYKGLAEANYSTLELPSTFERLSPYLLKDSVDTVIIHEDAEKIDISAYSLAKRESPLTIVCSNSVRESILEECQKLANGNNGIEMSDFDKVTLLSHAEFDASKEASSLNEQYPVLGEVDSSGQLAKFINEHALCYEERDGVAKVSFENGSGIIISDSTVVTYEIVNGEEIAIAAADVKDMSTDKLLEVLENVEKDGARGISLDVETDNVHDNDGGFSFDD